MSMPSLFIRSDECVLKEKLNHVAMVHSISSIYNLGRVHQTLPITPAMQAGPADQVRSMDQIVNLLGGK